MNRIDAISANLTMVQGRIAQACALAQRPPGSVMLLAVSKTFDAQAVRDAADAGLRAFGENYVQEGVDKIRALADLPLEWHMIGPVQSNKSQLVANHFAWVHSVDRLKIAQRLSQQRPPGLPPLQVCLQVNLDNGPNKSGVAPSQLEDLALAVVSLQQLCLRGLMCIPEPSPDPVQQRQLFDRAADLFSHIGQRLGAPAHWDTLSMGMSADLEAAIAAGSTMVRVGTALFGKRPPPAPQTGVDSTQW